MIYYIKFTKKKKKRNTFRVKLRLKKICPSQGYMDFSLFLFEFKIIHGKKSHYVCALFLFNLLDNETGVTKVL